MLTYWLQICALKQLLPIQVPTPQALVATTLFCFHEFGFLKFHL